MNRFNKVKGVTHKHKREVVGYNKNTPFYKALSLSNGGVFFHGRIGEQVLRVIGYRGLAALRCLCKATLEIPEFTISWQRRHVEWKESENENSWLYQVLSLLNGEVFFNWLKSQRVVNVFEYINLLLILKCVCKSMSKIIELEKGLKFHWENWERELQHKCKELFLTIGGYRNDGFLTVISKYEENALDLKKTLEWNRFQCVYDITDGLGLFCMNGEAIDFVVMHILKQISCIDSNEEARYYFIYKLLFYVKIAFCDSLEGYELLRNFMIKIVCSLSKEENRLLWEMAQGFDAITRESIFKEINFNEEKFNAERKKPEKNKGRNCIIS